MNSGATAERVYDAVKRRILAGRYRPGERIEVAALAQELDSSNTPVRDALHLLVGERLIETRAGDGFHIRQVDAPSLNDRYEWNAQVLLQALRKPPLAESSPSQGGPAQSDTGPALQTGAIFTRIAEQTGNSEVVREIGSLNDRLHAARIAESYVLPDWQQEIAEIEEQVEGKNAAALRRSIACYHRRRQRVVMEIIRALSHLPIKY
jgi:DNA-binding FadR family transcriptional regulator